MRRRRRRRWRGTPTARATSPATSSSTGVQSGNPSTPVDVGNVTSRQFSGLQVGVTYYFRVVAYNTSAMQSGPSAEVSYTPTAPPAPPTLSSVSPASGPTTGGTVITLNGANFVSGASVFVGGAPATSVTFLSATQLRATTPTGTAGLRTVQVTNPDAQSVTLNNAFTYVAAGADRHLGVAGIGDDDGRHHDHDQRHGLRLGRDGARRRRVSDGCHVRQRRPAAREHAGGKRRRGQRAGHQPGFAVGDAGQRLHLHRRQRRRSPPFRPARGRRRAARPSPSTARTSCQARPCGWTACRRRASRSSAAPSFARTRRPEAPARPTCRSPTRIRSRRR